MDLTLDLIIQIEQNKCHGTTVSLFLHHVFLPLNVSCFLQNTKLLQESKMAQMKLDQVLHEQNMNSEVYVLKSEFQVFESAKDIKDWTKTTLERAKIKNWFVNLFLSNATQQMIIRDLSIEECIVLRYHVFKDHMITPREFTIKSCVKGMSFKHLGYLVYLILIQMHQNQCLLNTIQSKLVFILLLGVPCQLWKQ